MSSKKHKSSCHLQARRKHHGEKSRGKRFEKHSIRIGLMRYLLATKVACTGRGRRLTFSTHYFLGVFAVQSGNINKPIST